MSNVDWMSPAKSAGRDLVSALVGDVHHLDAGLHLQHLVGEMRGAAHADRSEVVAAGLGAAGGDQLLRRLDR